MTASRRVRTLHLRAAQENLLRGGAIVLEDALRTASLPAAEGARLLIVRRLSLDIRVSAPSMTAALTLEQRLGQLDASAVHAEDPCAADSGAVFFRDEVEPCIILAQRVALGKDVGAWFWKPAVSGWQPGIPAKQSLRWLLYRTLETDPGSASVVRMAQALMQACALTPLLEVLEREDGVRLLQSFSWPMELESSEQQDKESPAQHVDLPQLRYCNTFWEYGRRVTLDPAG